MTAPPNGKILIVEDDPGISQLEVELIEDLGQTAIHAADGQAALALLAGEMPRLMLLDYSLPDMTGSELLDRIAAAGLAVPPFIVATGAGDEYVAVRLMQRGAHNYLIKDQDFLKLLPQAIRRALYDIELAQRLKVAETRLRLAARIMDSTSEGIYVTDDAHCIIETNPACERITGYCRDELIGRRPETLLPGHAEDRALALEVVGALECNGHWQGEMPFRRKSGEVMTAWLNITRIDGGAEDPPRYVTLFADISTVKASAEHLDYLAHHDPLTGLPNRLLFSARLRHSIERSGRGKHSIGLLFIDLDHFKLVNDRLGHAAGDDLLRLLANRMNALLREEDTLARLGGDEFVMLIEEAENAEDLQRVVGQILALFPHSVATPEGAINVTASIGGALFPLHAESCDDLIACADRAMYQAKEAGRNTFVLHGASGS